jgi:hypothetical protein
LEADNCKRLFADHWRFDVYTSVVGPPFATAHFVQSKSEIASCGERISSNRTRHPVGEEHPNGMVSKT